MRHEIQYGRHKEFILVVTCDLMLVSHGKYLEICIHLSFKLEI
jgi:hypothetical protein